MTNGTGSEEELLNLFRLLAPEDRTFLTDLIKRCALGEISFEEFSAELQQRKNI